MHLCPQDVEQVQANLAAYLGLRKFCQIKTMWFSAGIYGYLSQRKGETQAGGLNWFVLKASVHHIRRVRCRDVMANAVTSFSNVAAPRLALAGLWVFSQWPDGARDRGDCPASSDDGAINACEDRDAGGAISACDGAINACDHRGPRDNPSGIIGGGELREGDQQSTSSLNSLWTALRGLQSRIRGVPTRKEETVETGAKIPEASAEISPIPLMHDDLNLSPITTTSATLLEVSSGTFPTATKHGKSRDEIDREVDAMWNMTEKTVRPSLARRLAQAAALAATLMAPLSDLMGMTTNNLDLMEIACAPTSTLTSTFLDEGFQCRRINYKTGFDLETRKGTDLLAKEIGANPPRLGWVSMWCTRLSALQNLTMRTEEQMDKFLKRRGQDLRRCSEVVDSLEPILETGGDVVWEWPRTAVAGWSSNAIKKLQKMIKRHHRQIYWIHIDGCQYGLQWRGQAVKKAWTLLTTSRELWLSINKRCDHSHEHVHCRGEVAQASAYYPPKLCKDICKVMKHCWQRRDRSLEQDAQTYLLDIPKDDFDVISSADLHRPHCGQALHPPQEHRALALSRTRLDLPTAPTGKRLEEIKQLMLRVHRASGHSGMSNLQELLRSRGAPGWALEIAGKLHCPECAEASRPGPKPPASLGETPSIFEILGTDVFEYEDEKAKTKMKFILWRDRACGLCMIDHLKTYAEGSWEPTSQDIIKSMMKWQMTYPTPKWVMSDAARYYTSSEFMEYLNRAGVGLTVAPAGRISNRCGKTDC